MKKKILGFLLAVLLIASGLAFGDSRIIDGVPHEIVTVLDTDILKIDQNVETLTGNKTLVVTDMSVQKLDPGGSSRDITLPAEASSTDLVYYVFNTANGSGEDLTVKNDSPATVVTLGPEMGMMFSCDGTSWLAMDDEGIVYDAIADTVVIDSQLTLENSIFAQEAADPTHVFDGSTASDTDYWIGLVADEEGDDDDYFQIGKGTTPGTTPNLTLDKDGNFGINTETPDSQLEISKDSDSAEATLSSYHDTEATSPTIIMRKAEGTEASHATPVDDDAVLGIVTFQGYDGSGFHEAARIEARIDGTPSDGTDMPGELSFWTVPDDSATAVQRMTIDDAGNVSIGTTSPDQRFHAEEDNAATNTAVPIERLSVTSTGTPAAGLGPSMEFETETAAGSPGNQEVIAAIEGIATDVSSGTEDGAVIVKCMTGGAAATECARFTHDGGIVHQYKTIYTDAGAMVPCTTNGALQGTNEYGTNDIDFDYYAFDGGATEERIQFKFVMPEDWDRSDATMKAKFYWSSATGSTANDTVEWGIKSGALANDVAIDTALGTAVTVSDVLLANNGADIQISAATAVIVVAQVQALGDIIVFEVYRNTDGTDDMAEDAWLFGVLLQYKATNTVAAW